VFAPTVFENLGPLSPHHTLQYAFDLAIYAVIMLWVPESSNYRFRLAI